VRSSLGRSAGSVVCRRTDSHVRRQADVSASRICRPVDVDEYTLRYVPLMPGIRAIVRMLRDRPFVADAVLACALAGLVLDDVFTAGGYLSGSSWVYVPVGLLMTVPLAWRRRVPMVVVVVVMGAFAAQSLILGSSPAPDVELVPALIATYSVAVHGQRWVPFVGGSMSLASGLVWLGLDDFLLPTVMFGGAWLAGRLVQNRQIHARAFEERTHVLEREREANARAAVAEERVRLARELHDVVGHSVSVMVVQAGAERLVLGEERLAEMSRLLGILRSQGEGLALAPQPSLPNVDALVQTVRDAGVPVELRVEGEQTRLPPGVDAAAYRILQEALTNVVKHAGPARASVVVRYGDRIVEIEVADDGCGPVNGNEPGYGLAGMRERVELHGGSLDTGRGAAGGFVVTARLPVEEVAR
jgi:signal transduction histidine kinase